MWSASLAWKIEFDDRVEKPLAALSTVNRRRVITYLEDRVVAGDPRALGQALQGRFSGLWRYKVGDYRIICRLQHDRLVVLVVDVGHRSAAYR